MADIIMTLDSLDEIPHYRMPRGFGIRPFDSHRRDDEAWARIEVAAGEFSTLEQARKRFAQWTSEIPDGVHSRCYFLLDLSTRQAIGTVTAWRGKEGFEDLGRIHWLAIDPEYQGRGLSKPLLAHALRKLRDNYSSVYLKTGEDNLRAQSLYRSLGFTMQPPGLRAGFIPPLHAGVSTAPPGRMIHGTR